MSFAHRPLRRVHGNDLSAAVSAAFRAHTLEHHRVTLLAADARALSQAREKFHTVLIDSPPLLNMADARLLGKLADGVVLVMRAAQPRGKQPLLLLSGWRTTDRACSAPS